MVEERRRLERELADARRNLALGGGGPDSHRSNMPDAVLDLGDGRKAMVEVKPGLTPRDLRGVIDQAKKMLGSGVAAFITVNDGKASVAAGVTDDLISTFNAVDLVRTAVEVLGGQGGGGRPDFAQGGGPDGNKAEEAAAALRSALGIEQVSA